MGDMGTGRHIDVAERRARLAARHHLYRTAADVEASVRDLVALHSSDPATPYLTSWARVPEFMVRDLDRALYERRSLTRLHAMRRTLFVVPTDEVATMQSACGQDVARTERRKIERWVAQARDADIEDARSWLRLVEQRTIAALADGESRRTQNVSAMVDELALRITVGSGKWTADVPLSSRLLFLLAMEGQLVRAEPAGSWRSSQYAWADARTWFTDSPAVTPDDLPAAEGRARLAHRWLRVHGPATTADLRWWAGWTVRRTEAALAAVGAVEVELDGSQRGWVLPDDIDAPGQTARGVALLPALDPTVMGWKEREWYLGDRAPWLFDRNGNAGPTVWIDGRVVGGWAQRAGGEVVVKLLEDVGSQATNAITGEAAALTDWLGGVVVTPRFRTPLERELSA